jgi:hypothetical protein
MGDAFKAAKSIIERGMAAQSDLTSTDLALLLSLIETLPAGQAMELLHLMHSREPGAKSPTGRASMTATDMAELERKLLGKDYDTAKSDQGTRTPNTSNTSRSRDDGAWTAEEFAAFAKGLQGMQGGMGKSKSRFAEMYGAGPTKMGFDTGEEIPVPRDREYLFVGGVGAGQRHHVPPSHDHSRARGFPTAMDMDMGRSHRDMPNNTEIAVDTYIKVTIDIGGLPLEVFAVQRDGESAGVVAANAARELITHYAPKAHKDCGECNHRWEYRQMQESKYGRYRK